MSTDNNSLAADLTPVSLRRARLQAELAGLDALKAAQAVTHARRRHQDADREAESFWHALYIELAPLPPTALGDQQEPRGALAALSLEERTALLLRMSERLSINAIGRVLDEPDDRVRAHLALAVKRMRGQLANGRDDRQWINELEIWLHQQAAVGARTSGSTSIREQPALSNQTSSGQPSSKPTRRARRSRLPLWLGLVGLLVAVGAARMTADRWLLQRGPETAPVVATDPLVEWLLLPAEDAELVENIDSPQAVAQLDFLLWLEQTDSSQAAPKETDATP